MKRFKHCLLALSILLAGAAAAQNTIKVSLSTAKDTISKNIYGHFAEHLGNCIYGGLYVGETNPLINQKNGIRLDIVEALKKLKTPVLRWPGGCFADNYHWKDAIGPKEKRKPIENISWGNVRENNHLAPMNFLIYVK